MMKVWRCLSTRQVTVISQECSEPTKTCKKLQLNSFSLTGKPRIDKTIEPSIGCIDQLFWKDSVDERKNAEAPAQHEFHPSSDALCFKILNEPATARPNSEG